MSSPVRLGSILDPERNSLTFVRFIAALAVIISHAFEIAVSRGAPQPFESTTPFNLGQHAVNAFFIISGLTLSRALAHDPDLLRYFSARALRIFPGLFVYGLVLAFIAGPLLSDLSWRQYLAAPETIFYPLSVLFFFAQATPPPGIFGQVPVAFTLNEPLWTIRYELAAYVGLAIMAALRWFPQPRAVVVIGVAVTLCYVVLGSDPAIAAGIPGAGSLARFALCFLAGVGAYIARDRIIVSPIYLILLACALWLLGGTVLEASAYIVFTAYLIFVLGAMSFGALGQWARRNDISYGTYLYGWPIQQSLVVLFPGIGVAANMLGALFLAPLAGYASWMLVERKALRLKRSFDRPAVSEHAG